MAKQRTTSARAVSEGRVGGPDAKKAVVHPARSLTLFSATNLVVANMVGAGIFTTSGLLLAELGDVRLMLALWLGGGLLALCGALSYGVLGAAMPEAGGEYVSLLAGTSLVLVLYLLLNVLFVYGAGLEGLSGEIAVGAVAAEQLFGPAARSFISALIAFALLSSISSLIILGPRVTYAMARDRRFFSFAGRIHATRGVPSRAIWLQGFIACVLAATGTFDQILTYMGFCLGIFPILAVLGVFRLPPEKRSLLAGLVLGGTAIPFVAVSTAMLILAYLERPAESSIALVTILAGLPAYAAFRRAERRRGVQPDFPGHPRPYSDPPTSPIDEAKR